MRELTSDTDLDALLREPEALLLKHGAHCPISAAAREELHAFAARRPELPIYLLEVTGHRELSNTVATRLSVAHASPQAFLLRDGRPTWRAEHFDITVDALEGAHADSRAER
jgi:bacillithiol system protein YtxJ